MRQRDGDVHGPSIFHRAFALWGRERPPWPRQVWVPGLFAVVALHALLIATPARPVRDSLAYIELGRNLATGQGYALFGVRDDLWPPGLPLMLAGVFRAVPDALWPARAMLAGWLLLAGWITYRLGRPLVGARVAALVALACVLNPAVVRLQRSILSEPPFAALVVAALACWSGWHRRDTRPWRWPALGALAAAAAVMVRTIGVVVGPALAISALICRTHADRARWDQGRSRAREGDRTGFFARHPLTHRIATAAVLLAGTAAGLGATHAITAGRAGGPWGYLDVASRLSPYDGAAEPVTPSALVLRTLRAEGRWWLHAGAAMLGDKNLVTGVVMAPLLLIAVVVGLIGRGGKTPTAIAWLLVLYSAGVSVTAFKAGVRFAVPLVPVFWLLCLAAVGKMPGRFARPGRVARAACIVVLVTTPLLGAGAVVHNAIRLRWGGPARRVRAGFELDPGHIEEIALLERWVPADAPTLSDNALLLRRVTGRPLFPTLALPATDATAERLDGWGIRYACIKKRWMRGANSRGSRPRPCFAGGPWIRLAEGRYAVILRRP